MDWKQILKDPKGKEIKNPDGTPAELGEVCYALGGSAYQNQPPEDRIELARIGAKIIQEKDVTSENIALLKKTATQIYNGFTALAIIEALESSK